MIYHHAPKKAFHKEHDAIQWSLRNMAAHANNSLRRDTLKNILEQEYINLNVAQALHAMNKGV